MPAPPRLRYCPADAVRRVPRQDGLTSDSWPSESSWTENERSGPDVDHSYLALGTQIMVDCVVVKQEDGVDLSGDDFRRLRRYLAPHLFAWPSDGEPETYPRPSDLVPEENWDHIMTLPTDVALKSSSYEGSAISRLAILESQWIFSWPEAGEAPFMEEVVLLAGEEFNALVFNALHGYYRQAIGCLRNALESLIVAAGLAVRNNSPIFERWRRGSSRSTTVRHGHG